MTAKNIGKYRILERLGRGGSGTMFKAVDETTGREVALKVLRQDVAGAEVLNRFELEAKALATLNHPGIATIYAVERVGDAVLLAMELVRGETLDQLLKRVGALPAERAAYLIGHVLGALGEAHAIGVIHRDLKPVNVMLTDRGSVKLLDFGIGHIEESAQMTAVAYVEPPAYMSPERILGTVVDARADLYSVGALFYRLLTDRVPFDAPNPSDMVAKQLAELPAPARTYRPDVPAWCEAVLARALAKSPADRFQSADEFRAALLESISAAVSETTGQYAVDAAGPTLIGHISAVVPQALAFPEATQTVTAPSISSPNPTWAGEATIAGTFAGTGSAPGGPEVQPLAPGPTASQQLAQDAPTMLAPAPMAPTVTMGALAPTVVAPMASAPTGTTLVMERKQFAAAGLILGSLALGVVVLAVIVLRRPAVVVDAPVTPANSVPAAAVPSPPVAPPDPISAAPSPMALVDPPIRTAPVERATPPPLTASVTTAPRETKVPASPSPSSSPNAPANSSAIDRVTNSAPFTFDGKAVVAEGDKRRERDASVLIADGSITVTQKGEGVLYVVPVAALTGLTYSNSKQPLWDAPAGPAEAMRVEGGAFGFLKGGRNWIGLRAADSLLFLRVDDQIVGRVIAGLQDRTGLTVARLIEPKE